MVHYQYPYRKWCTTSTPTENGAVPIPPQRMVHYQYPHREWCTTSTTTENDTLPVPPQRMVHYQYHHRKWCTTSTTIENGALPVPPERMVPQKNGALAVHRQNGYCRHTEWCITATQTELCSIATENGALPSQNHEWYISATQHGALAPHRRVH